MATLLELSAITQEAEFNDLANKVRAAVIIKAAAVVNDSQSPASRLSWASQALARPFDAGDGIIPYVLGANASASVANILSAPDTAIQANVNDAVDALYGA